MNQMQLPSMTKTNKYFTVSFVALFLINAMSAKAGISLAPFLGVSPEGVMSGKIWTIATYSFLPQGLLEVIFDALIFWFIGSELETMWGQKRYLGYLTSTAIAAAMIYLIIGTGFYEGASAFYPVSGPQALASSLCVTYAMLFPTRTMYFFFFPLQARWFVILLVGMNLYHGFFTPGAAMVWLQLAAMACGVLWMFAMANPKVKQFLARYNTPSSGSKNSKMSQFQKRKKRRSSKTSHLHIVDDPGLEDDDKNDDDDSNSPTYH